ncbi:hypothetical protein [Microbacterium sp. NPDC089188]|uniref:hypothetical protein n=1 Tax=Microbacterium sp. NPDC089188 TaxID=3154971 RepID=UPI00343D2695
MSTLSIKRAAKLVAAPTWADRPDYEREAEEREGGVFIMDTATIIEDPMVTVAVEWQTDVRPDGTVGPTLESIKLTTGDDSTFIESAQLAHVVFSLCHAAVLAGVIR